MDDISILLFGGIFLAVVIIPMVFHKLGKAADIKIDQWRDARAEQNPNRAEGSRSGNLADAYQTGTNDGAGGRNAAWQMSADTDMQSDNAAES